MGTVTQRNSAIEEGTRKVRKLEQGMCNCCHDGDTCLLGFPCCFSCTSYWNAKGLGKPEPFLYGLLGCFLPCFAINILRGEAREKYGIAGTLGGDVIKSCCCCLPCINCQLSNEVKSHGGYE